MDSDLVNQLASTAEVMDVTLSRPALKMLAEDLSGYSGEGIRQALRRLRQESGKFTVAEIVKRIPGMWPGAEIAWASAPRDEAMTFVTTREAMAAWSVACELDDKVAARMAFKESYDQRVSEAKSRGESPEWVVSLGHDVTLRDQVVLDAVRQGLLLPRNATVHLPHIPIAEIEQLSLGQVSTHALLELHQPTVGSIEELASEPVTTNESAKAHIAKLREALGSGAVGNQIDSLKRLHGK